MGEVYNRLENNIPLYVPTDCEPNSSVIIYGRRRSGKTTWVKWFMYWNRYKYDDVYVFSTTSFTGHYQTFVPDHHVFPVFREDIVQMIIDYQKEDSSRTFMVILDDVLDHMADIRKSTALTALFASGRHLNIAVIVCTQYPKALPPVFRQNVDVAVIFGSGSEDLHDMFHKSYGHALTKRMFAYMMEYHTADHGALIALPCTPSKNPLDVFRRSKAERINVDFTVGLKMDPGRDRRRDPMQDPPY